MNCSGSDYLCLEKRMGDLLNFSTLAGNGLLDDNLTELESQLSTALYSVQAQLGRVLVSILFAFGIVGNALLFCACVQSKLRQQSYSYFLRALVVLDSANLFVILLEVFAKVAQDSLFTGEAGCKAWEYFRQVCGTMSWWLTASLSCERFMILYHPLRGRVFCRGQHVLAVIIVLFLASLALQVHAIVQTTYTEEFGCHPVYTDGSFGDLDVFVYKAFGYLLPTVVIVVCNCFVLRKVDSVCVRVNCGDMATTTTTTKTRRSQQQQQVHCRFQKKRSEVTVMLLIITFASVFAAMPTHIANFVTYLGGENVITVDFVLMHSLSPLLKATLMVTYSCNFYAYILFSTFRKQLKAFVGVQLRTSRCCVWLADWKRSRQLVQLRRPFAQSSPEATASVQPVLPDAQSLQWLRHRQFVNNQYHVLLMNMPNRPTSSLFN